MPRMKQTIARLAHALLRVETREIRVVALSFSFILTLMAAYYLLRPVRDAMASDWSDAELSFLWTLNFFLSAAAVLVYGGAVSRLRLRRLVPTIYTFFALSFLAFFLATQVLADTRLIDQAFYVWVSFFALFHVSVFWSFMAGIYSREQSKRLFGLIGAGASIGAVIGPTIPVFFSEWLGVYPLLLIAALLLIAVLPLIFVLERTGPQHLSSADAAPESIGGSFVDGFIDFVGHRFLLGIGLFILLYTVMSTFVYFELKTVMAEFDRPTRAQYWGLMDLIVNSLAILTALFATGRIASRLGIAVTLALVPALMIIGWLMVALAPGVGVLVALQIIRRAGNYAVTRPGREMLFTAVSPATRFKTKPVLDIVVYRGGDVVASWAYTGLAQGIGLGLGTIALVASALAALWMLLGIYLGVHHESSPQPRANEEGVIP